ncbi:MAG: ADOP family duplicated permease [Gemmatimonadota bacterium]
MSAPRPSPWSRLVERLLVWVAGRDRADAILGDLAEELSRFQESVRGERGARHWYRRQVMGSLLPLAAARVRGGLSGLGARGGDGMMSELMRDVRHTLRSFGRSPGFTAVIILTLALGIGANTIIYSAVDGLVLHPFPFPDGDRLVAVGTQYPRLGQTQPSYIEHMAPADYVALRDEAESLTRVVAWDMGNRQVSFGEVTENVFTGLWWGDAFPTLGVQPELGRGMSRDETLRGEPVAVLSHRLWTRAFGADESLVGRSIMMNGNPYTVVGIMPPGTVLYGMDLWIPMGIDPSEFPRTRRQFQVIGRVADGYSLDQVNAELETLARSTEATFAADFDQYTGWRMVADTWTGANVRTLRPAAFLLLGAVGFVLLLVCTNIASLLLARSARRRREMALRRAIGASRGRLLRQVLTESVTVSVAGGAIGVLVAWIGVQGVADIVARFPFVSGGVALNGRVLLFTGAVSVLAGIGFGLVPALHGSRTDVQGDLKADTAGTTAHGSRLRVQRFFVAVEVALALVLLAGGGLLLNSVLHLNRVDPGFAADEVLTMRLTLPREEYDGPAMGVFFRDLEERVASIPGVEAAGVGSQFPPVAFSYGVAAAPGLEVRDEGELPTVMTTLASPDYFDALGIPLLRGRAFNDLDAEGSPLVGVLNEAAVDLLFPDGADPVGQHVVVQGDPVEVVGVSANTLNQGIDEEPYPEVFADQRQVPGWSNQLFVLVRTTVAPMSVLPAVRAEVRALDADQPVYAIRTAAETLAQATAPRRVAANVLSVFAAFALLLAAVGIFSVVSFTVADRTREIGLRVALGAAADQVRWLMVRQALVPVVVGAAIGLGGAIAAGQAIEGLLFGVGGTDPATLAGVVAILLGSAFLASYLPARRASRLDPVAALREE